MVEAAVVEVPVEDVNAAEAAPSGDQHREEVAAEEAAIDGAAVALPPAVEDGNAPA